MRRKSSELARLGHVCFALFAALALLAAVGGAAGAQERRLTTFEETDLPGGDYDILRDVPLSQCQAACLADTQCAGFTYNRAAAWCFLKSEVGERQPYANAVSGDVATVAARSEPLPLPAALDFLPESVVVEQAQLMAQASAAARTGREVGVYTPSLAETLLSGGTAEWLRFANSRLASITDDWQSREREPRIAAAAGYVGLTRATSPAEQAEALEQIGIAFERQSLWRPAIEAMKASLAIRDTPRVAQRFASLREQYGFRILDYSVDADAASPRMCVQFSENIEGDAASVEPYVTIDSIPRPVVSVEANQVCIDGLEHGERYAIGIRPGVRSVVGERLEQPASYTIYIRDRAPAARFSGNDYVLPRIGGEGIPVVTINANVLDMKLYRIDDRGIAAAIRSGDFKRELSPWETSDLENETGVLVWSGEMPVETVLNTEVTTAFPVSEAAGRLEAGVYVLTAKPRAATDEYAELATQWFIVSDVGLTALTGEDAVDVFARSLGSAGPIAGAEIELVARNNAVLATAVTDADGHARLAFDRQEAQGGLRPALVTAAVGTADFAFLSLAGGAFELTDRGVEGRAAPGSVDAFLYTERGVYRAGETVHLTTLVRDDDARAVEGVPVTLVITRPDGVEARRIVRTPTEAGGFAEPIELLTTAQTGTWRVAAYLDPKAPPVGSTSWLVEDFVPERIEVSLEPIDALLDPGAAFTINGSADYLYGAPAAGLMIEGEVVVQPAEGHPDFPGYRFGLESETFAPVRAPLFALPRVGEDGRFTIEATVPETPETSHLLQAEVTVRVREPSGRTVGEDVSAYIEPSGPVIGIRPRFDGQVGYGDTAAFDVIALTPELERRSMSDLEWQLVRIHRHYQWYRTDGRWNYQPIERTERVAGGVVDVGTGTPAEITASVDWGRYRLEVSDPRGRAATGVLFSAGWMAAEAGADTPDQLEIHLDRADYAPGDTAELTIDPRFAGTALVTVLGQNVEYFDFAEVPEGGTTVPIPVGEDWGAGAYVTVSLLRPGEAGASRMPQRAIGVAWLAVDTAPRTLTVAIEAPEQVRPRQPVEIPIAIGNLDPGETAYFTLAAVDVGILNLTDYEAPDPVGWYLGQRRLGVEVRDLYGDLIDPFGAARGRIRSGGDAPSLGGEALPPTQQPVSLFHGVAEAGPDGTATVTFELPAFNGTLRLMAVAWTAAKVGNAERDMTVRDPVVVLGSTPRFLAPGDQSRLRFDLDNVDGPAGSYTLSLDASGPLLLDENEVSLSLAAAESASAEIALSAADVGLGEIVATLAGPDGLTLDQTFTIAVRAPAPETSRRLVRALTPGETARIDESVFAGVYADGADVSVTVTRGLPIDIPGLLTMLDRFPYGCAEQTTSRALPLLYVNDIAASVGMTADASLRERIEGAIARVLSFQDSSGGFGLWGPGYYDSWLSAYVMDFLTRAQESGFEVPELAMTLGLDRLQNELAYVTSFEGDNGDALAYATYVLARNGRAPIGDLRYYVDEKLREFDSPLAQAQLGAALSFVGDQRRAESVFQTAAFRMPSPAGTSSIADYGTPLRDVAATLALAAETNAGGGVVDDLIEALGEARAADPYDHPSTQEATWMVLAAHGLASARDGPRLAIDGDPRTGNFYARYEADALRGSPVAVTNEGTETLEMILTVNGVPREPLPAAENGLTIERQYYTLDGEATSPDRVAQNERMVVVLTATVTAPAERRLLLADLLPAGFEIENPRLVSGASLAAFPGVDAGPRPVHAEFRDDRFVAAWNVSRNQTGPLIAAYLVRAVTPGSYVHPAAQIEDMYQPGILARTGTGSVAILPTR